MSISIEYEYIWYVCKKVTPKGLHVNLQYWYSIVLHMDMCHKLQYCYTLLNSKLYILVQACPAKKVVLFLFGHLFFNINMITDVFRAKTRVGHACIYPTMVTGQPILKLYPPPKKLALPLPKKGKFRGEAFCFCSKFSGQNCVLFNVFQKFCHSDLDSREQQARSDPTRLIQPCPIGCDRGSDQPVTIFPFFALFFRNNANKKFLIGSPI